MNPTLKKILMGAVATVAAVFVFNAIGASLPKLPGART